MPLGAMSHTTDSLFAVLMNTYKCNISTGKKVLSVGEAVAVVMGPTDREGPQQHGEVKSLRVEPEPGSETDFRFLAGNLKL